MFKIVEDSPKRLLIHTPDLVHKFQTVFFILLGLLPTISIILDPDTPIFIAIFPFGLFVAGIIMIFVGGKPDVLEYDRVQRIVRVLVREVGGGKNAEPMEIQLEEIDHSVVEKAPRSFTSSQRSLYGINLYLKSGEKLQGTVYTNGKKKVEKLHDSWKLATGK